MRHTLAVIVFGAAMPLAAQVAPARPAPAAPPAAPAPRAEPSPRALPAPRYEPRWDFDFRFDSEAFRIDAERIRHDAWEAARAAEHEWRQHRPEVERAMELARVDMDRVRDEARRSMMDSERIQREAMQSLRNTPIHVPPVHVPPVNVGPINVGPINIGPMELGWGGGDKLLRTSPRAAWLSEDPADSLYRVAREALNRGEYRRAAQVFNEVVKKYPRSGYAVSSAYWEAFARYRTGTTEDLNAAWKLLDEWKDRFAEIRNDGDSGTDSQALRARVMSALAARGDQRAAEALKREVGQGATCDREEISVRAEALSALNQMDAATALPIVKRVLARRDDCSTELRRRAVYVAGRQTTSPEAAAVILDVAKNDPDNSIRGEAMRMLPRVAGDNAVPQIEEILRTSTEEQQQRSAVQALASMDSDRARRALRTIIERPDAVERVRYDAISYFLRERDGRQPTAEEQTYVRTLYGKVESTRLKEAVVYAVSRVESAESKQFLVEIVRNQNETSSLRANALSRFVRMNTVTVPEIARLYDVADTRSLREQILSGLSQRKEDEAVTKMIDIGKKDTDPRIRSYAITLLSRSTNPIAVNFMKDMWNQP